MYGLTLKLITTATLTSLIRAGSEATTWRQRRTEQHTLPKCGDAMPIGTEDLDQNPIHILSSDGETVQFQIKNTFNIAGDADLFVTVNRGLIHECLEFSEVAPGAAVLEDLTSYCFHSTPEAHIKIFVDAEDLALDLDPHSFEKSVCCAARPVSDPPKKVYNFMLPCTPCSSMPENSTSTSNPPAQATRKRSLQEEIIKDMMPESSSQCTPIAVNASFTFQSSQAESEWWEAFIDFEEYVFLAKMQHQDLNTNRSWTVRFGQAGNIYSFVGPMGETVPPQRHSNAPWVDEVWQAVQPLGPGSDNDGDPNTDRFFIHEAGTYQRDGEYTKVPVYSPSVGRYCDEEGGECGFISWGQQAHIPTPWKSPMLYLNRYVNCGDGVFEHTALRHNNVGSPETFSYLNVPWGGVRNTVLKDIVMTHHERGLEVQYPLASFGQSELRGLGDTLGFTIFAEDLPKYAPEDNTLYPIPDGLNLTVGQPCYDEGPQSIRYVCPLLPQSDSLNIGYDPNKGDPGLIVKLEGVDGKSIVAGIRHWSAAGNRMFFYKSPDLTLSKIQETLPVGTTMVVKYYLPPTGKPEEDNLALAHIHGGQDLPKGQSYPRVRCGAAGRDFNVYTINSVPNIRSGDTYFYRQYFALDSYPNMASTASSWAPQALEEQYGASDRPGRSIQLYSDGSSRFGFVMEGTECAAASSSTSSLVCGGRTTPQSNTKALFQIQCGTTVVVTDDLYALSPTGPPYRSYQCAGMAIGTRPTWTLLGFFDVAQCSSIASGFFFEAEFCNKAQVV